VQRTDGCQTATDEAAEHSRPGISVCVCTYRRPVQLAALIERLAAQQGQPGISEMIVVDNDAAASARAVVAAARLSCPLRYDVQPVKNIALTRNRAIALARGDWIGFLDDDELPQTDWLVQLHAAATRFGADGVFAPVLSVVPETAPSWIRGAGFFGRQRFSTGAPVPRNELRIGNALIASSWLRRFDGPFNPDYGLTGGEDSDLLARLGNAGARFVWCDEAAVTEPVEPGRLRLASILRTSYCGGQTYARLALAGAYGAMGAFARLRFIARATAAMIVALTVTIATLPRGRRGWVGWLCKACAQAGKLTALAGHRYEKYR
jgi:succinoglycan biosynthesis protein ExoM